MKTFTKEELALIIKNHHAWLNSEKDGEQANLSCADLSYADLSYADLRYADLRSADLSCANLSSANLSSAELRYANLSCADLRYADLRYADLRSANLSYADLRYANLSCADLSCADLSCADLRYANLSYTASLCGTVGNLSQVKSVQCDIWPVTYTATHMQIGCQFHLLADWWEFSGEEISRMDFKAAAWWEIWKPILKMIIEASPAVPIEIQE